MLTADWRTAEPKNIKLSWGQEAYIHGAFSKHGAESTVHRPAERGPAPHHFNSLWPAPPDNGRTDHPQSSV